MTPESVEHRHTHEADPEAVEVRQPDAVDDGNLFRIRMPITSTGEARDGEAFSDERLRGFQQQLRDERVPLFLDHGRGGPGETRYSQLRKVGYWDAPSIEERNGATDLDADAVLVDPDTLDDDVGDIRAALAWLRAQAEAGLPISASVGWSEDTGDRSVPGDADLLEVSIVGIPSDPRTTTTADSDAAVLARAVDTATTEFDVATFVRELARASERPFGPPDGDGDEFEDFEDCVQTLMDDDPDLDREDAEAICGSWQQDSKDTDMTDQEDTAGEEPADTNDDQDGIDAAEFRESMLEMQRNQTETLNSLAEAIRADGMDGDDEDDDDDDMDEEASADVNETSDADADDTDERAVEVDGEAYTADDIRELRDELAGTDAEDIEAPDTQDRVADDAAAEADTADGDADGPDWRA